MTGRTVSKHTRFYMDGYDLSGDVRSVGPLTWELEVSAETALTDGVKNVLPNHATISPGTLDAFLDNTATTGLHVIASGAGTKRTVMIPVGMRAAPAAGDPVFVGQFEQAGYQQAGDVYVGVNIPFEGWSDTASSLAYGIPWGLLLHANGAETAANSTTGAGIDGGAQTTAGGYMVYQIFGGTGAVTISIDDSADDSSYAALDDATTGEIADASVPQAGIIALGKTATVEQYLRWQIAAGGGFSTVTFALAFVRGR